MLKALRFLLPPPAQANPEDTRQARVLYSLLITVFALSLPLFITLMIQSPRLAPGAQASLAVRAPFIAMFIVAGVTVLALALLHQGRVYAASHIFLLFTFLALSVNAYFQGGITSGSTYLALSFILAATLLVGERMTYLYMASFAAVFSYLTFIEYRRLLPVPAVPFTPFRIWLILMIVFVIAGVFIHLILSFARENIDRARGREKELAHSNEQLRLIQASLEQRVTERTAELERRARQFQATAEVGRAAATFTELDQLLPQATRLISQQFDFYHVGLFLLDRAGQHAELRAASSLGGQEMLAKGHRLPVGGQSVVGAAAASRQPRISQVIGGEGLPGGLPETLPEPGARSAAVPAPHRINPYLPETRSEMALPLVVSNQVIGVLDVQSVEPAAFTEEDMTTLQILADQLALAINNARLITETQAALDVTRRVYGDISRQAWRERLQDRPLALRRDAQGLSKLAEGAGLPEPAENEKPSAGRADAQPGPSLAAAVPIRIRGEIIGYIQANKAAGSGPWSQHERTLLETLVEQLGIALDSARLHEETRERAELERLVAEATAQMRATLDIETVLQTAAREMRRALDLSEVDLRLGSASKPAA